jgi:ribosomal protein S11
MREKLVVTFKKTINNFFITIFRKKKGEVLLTKSAGNFQIFSKKKKKSFDTVKNIAVGIAKEALVKGIRIIDLFYVTHAYLKNSYIIFYSFKSAGVIIKELHYIKKKIHAIPLRKKKLRRL